MYLENSHCFDRRCRVNICDSLRESKAMGQNEIPNCCAKRTKERTVKNDQGGSTVTEETEGRRRGSLASEEDCEPPLGQ